MGQDVCGGGSAAAAAEVAVDPIRSTRARRRDCANGSSALGRFVAAGSAVSGPDGAVELTMARQCVASDDPRAKWKLRELKACVLSAMGADAAVGEARGQRGVTVERVLVCTRRAHVASQPQHLPRVHVWALRR